MMRRHLFKGGDPGTAVYVPVGEGRAGALNRFKEKAFEFVKSMSGYPASADYPLLGSRVLSVWNLTKDGVMPRSLQHANEEEAAKIASVILHEDPPHMAVSDGMFSAIIKETRPRDFRPQFVFLDDAEVFLHCESDSEGMPELSVEMVCEDGLRRKVAGPKHVEKLLQNE